MPNVSPRPNNPAELMQRLAGQLRAKQFELPTLPEIPLKVRRLVEQRNASTPQLVRLLSADPVLTGRIVLRANSVLYANLPQVRTLQGAVERLGFIPTRNLVISLTMSRIYQGRGPEQIRKRLSQLWRLSTHVAALCQIFARRAPHLDASEALLAGLLHNIGALPVVMAYANQEQLLSDQELTQLVEELAGELGGYILEAWHMPEAMVRVASGLTDISRSHDGPADYQDVAQIAALHAYRGSRTCLGQLNHWQAVPAFKRLGLSPDDSIEATRLAYKEIAALQQILR